MVTVRIEGAEKSRINLFRIIGKLMGCNPFYLSKLAVRVISAQGCPVVVGVILEIFVIVADQFIVYGYLSDRRIQHSIDVVKCILLAGTAQ